MQSAIENDNLEILKYLIKLKQDENVQISQLCDHEGNTLLSKAIMKSKYEIVRYLIETYACLISTKNAHGSYPIHFASIQSNMHIVRLVCRESKKFINTRDNASYSPAMLAAQYGQYEVLKYLLDNMNAKYTKITKKEKYTLLHIGVRSGSLDIVQYLIMKMGSAYLKRRTKDGATIYHLAAACGHDKILEYLLAHKVAKELKNSKDITGSTAAHDCAENGHFKCLKLLHDSGLNMFEEDLGRI
jgi:ankyrin repeat protein